MSCVAVQIEITIEAFENKEIVLMLGNENDIINAKNTAYKYSKVSKCVEELNNVKR